MRCEFCDIRIYQNEKRARGFGCLIRKKEEIYESNRENARGTHTRARESGWEEREKERGTEGANARREREKLVPKFSRVSSVPCDFAKRGTDSASYICIRV